MENEKLFEFMEKIYGELQSTKAEMHQEFAEVKSEVRKNSISIEDMQKDIKTLAEVQQSNYEENQRNHKEIVEMLTERLDTQDKVIRNITVVK